MTTRPARHPVVIRLAALAAGVLATALTGQVQAQESPTAPFGFEEVQQRARAIAQAPFDERAIHLDDWLKQFDYDDYREIEYRREKGLWADTASPFQVQFFHRGGIFPNPVQIHVVRNGVEEPFRFDPDLFNYRALQRQGEVPEGLGFAGFKVLTPLNADHYDEVMSFLGASYYRVVGKDNWYGLSMRGLAIDASKWGHEEFPWFREFWIEEPTTPADGTPNLRVYALLDSQSVTGAYQFDLQPGDPTVVTIHCTLYTRKDIGELGIAPLTSMYLFGETDPYPVGVDFRPEVHDSDGLQIHYGQGEFLWKPLINPARSAVTRYPADGFKGWGLLQRDRNFENYQDLEAIYQRRPSAWIEPISGFGAGAVTLLELSSDSEANDSTVNYWVPAAEVKAGQELSFAYRMSVGGAVLDTKPAGYVVATRQQASGAGTRFVVDFSGPALDALPADAPVQAVVTVINGSVGPAVVQRNPYNGTWRLFFDAAPAGGEPTPAHDGTEPAPVELRAFLKLDEHVLTETWSYRCLP